MQISGSDDEHNVAPGYVVPSHWGPGKALVSPELFLVGNLKGSNYSLKGAVRHER